ncbi:unnamed protein product [Dicrocoelium dendriticum]|nr:unnamed protein product [Dicrocoelium dendriticum]
MSKKKKNVDFQKVRIKVGRKLKRQNETVVDLIRKKIKLPRERETFQEEESIKQASRILDVAIDSLNLEKPVLQLEALRSLNSILDPFAKQLMLFTHSTHSHLTLQSCSMKSLLLIYRALLQSDKPSDLGLQLGDLLSVLTRVCRGAQDPGICVDLFKLFLNIVKLFSFHPNFPDLLRTVHQCAIALLQRVESSWFWLGCKLTCLVLQKHCELVSLFTEVHHDRGVSRFADPMEQLVRCSLLSRCLSQLYAHLREASIRDRSNDRINLLETTLAYFKDDQYSMYSACTGGSHPFVFHPPSIPSDTNSRILTYIPLNGLNLCQFANWNETTTSMDLSFIEMETPKLLFSKMEPYASALTPSKKPKGATKAEFRGKVNYNLTRPALGDERQRHEQAVLVGMLNEGFHLLDDLSRGPEAPVFLGLFYVIRCLRVLFEHKPWIFSSQNRSASPSSDSKR